MNNSIKENNKYENITLVDTRKEGYKLFSIKK